MKTIKIVFVQLIVLAVGLVCVELALAYFLPLPVHGGVFVNRNGDIVGVAENELELKPSLDVVHVSAEFSKRMRTNDLGYRRIGDDDRAPDVVFLGDSFTFGHGVTDEEAFATIVCTRRTLACQNLGRPGTDTFDQLEILSHALDARGMHPRTVILVMLAACWLDSYGNDLGDNHLHYLRLRSAAIGATTTSWQRPRSAGAAEPALPVPAGTQGPEGGEALVKRLQRVFGSYEIAKRMMLIASSRLKRGLYGCSADDRLRTAMEATGVALRELERMAASRDFKVKLFAVHPYQELDGAFRTTEKLVAAAAPPSFEYIPTARHFRKDDYYPYDGHFNAQGHARMASLIEASLARR